MHFELPGRLPKNARIRRQSLMGCEPCPFSRPLGAMREVDDTRKVWDAFQDKDKYVVVQFAPAIRATLGEEFGMEPGTLVTGKLYAALRRLGIQQVWDTNFTADLTIMEEGYELIHRLEQRRQSAAVHVLFARLDSLLRDFLSRFDSESFDGQVAAADARRGGQDLRRREVGRRSRENVRRVDHALHGQED